MYDQSEMTQPVDPLIRGNKKSSIQTAVSMIRTVVCYQAVGGLADGTGAAMAVWHENTRPSGTKLS